MATVIPEDSVKNPLPRGIDLPYEDGEPLESEWHLAAMTLLIDILRFHFRDRSDVYTAGNMFVYFDPEQDKKRNFRGPDFFVVKGARGNHLRNSWVVWEEGGLTPDYVIELASESTKAFDVTGKKAIYEQELKTPEYIVYDPATEELRGWRLDDQGRYQALAPDGRGWLWSEQLDLWLGLDDDTLANGQPIRTLRFFDTEGDRLPTKDAARANIAEEELARLRAELAKKG